MKKDRYKIIEKAWSVNLEGISEPWYHEGDVYYGTRGSAKNQFLVEHYEAKTTLGDDISFTNISMVRNTEHDKIEVDGYIIKRCELNEHLRLKKLSDLPKDKMYYVQDKRSYVGNSVVWWGLNGNGYTTNIANAQKYTWDEIQKFNPRYTDIIWQADHVENNIIRHVDMQYLDKQYSL